jgi:hypothetical protein
MLHPWRREQREQQALMLLLLQPINLPSLASSLVIMERQLPSFRNSHPVLEVTV